VRSDCRGNHRDYDQAEGHGVGLPAVVELTEETVVTVAEPIALASCWAALSAPLALPASAATMSPMAMSKIEPKQALHQRLPGGGGRPRRRIAHRVGLRIGLAY
jgi:hypothetical protein